MRSLRGGTEAPIVRLGYQRNTVDVDDAVAQLNQIQQQALQQKTRLPIKAVIMVPTYRAAAKFIEKTRDLYPDMIYTSVSFVGSTALANELTLLGKKYAAGVIVTQVVPARHWCSITNPRSPNTFPARRQTTYLWKVMSMAPC